jgi:hypothetical protein
MKRTSWIIIAAAAAALLAWMLTRAPMPANAGDKILANLRPEAIEKISISNGEESVTLQLSDGEWTVAGRGGYPADGARVLSLVRRAWDLKPVQTIEAGPSHFAKLRLAPPDAEPGTTATEIAFFDADNKSLGGLRLGKRQTREGTAGAPGTTVGRYVIESGSEGPVALVSEIFDDAAPSPAMWLDRRFPAFTDLQSIQFKGSSEERQWTLERGEDGSWTIDGEAADSGKVYSALSTWNQPHFQDILAPDSPEAENFKPVEQLIFTRTNGETITLHISPPSGTTTPVRVSIAPPAEPTDAQSKSSMPDQMEKTIYLFPTSNVETLARSRESLTPDQQAAGN